jgi:signal transduction histidine kinase
MPTNVHAVDYFALVPIWRKARIPFLSALILGTLLFRSLLTEQKATDRLAALNLELRELELKVERERIARDIHDSLGHSLTSLNIQLDVALHLLAQGRSGAEASLKTAKVLSKQCLVDVRKALRTIKEPDLDYAAAVAQLVETCNKQNLCRVEATINQGDMPLNQAVSHHPFCIVQETLTNCLKHAGAKAVTVKQEVDNEGLKLNIKDDGCGFDVSRPAEGNGIMSMKYRAESLGGTFCLTSQPGRGTEIAINIPLLTPLLQTSSDRDTNTLPGAISKRQAEPEKASNQLEEQRA